MLCQMCTSQSEMENHASRTHNVNYSCMTAPLVVSAVTRVLNHISSPEADFVHHRKCQFMWWGTRKTASVHTLLYRQHAWKRFPTGSWALFSLLFYMKIPHSFPFGDAVETSWIVTIEVKEKRTHPCVFGKYPVGQQTLKSPGACSCEPRRDSTVCLRRKWCPSWGPCHGIDQVSPICLVPSSPNTDVR